MATLKASNVNNYTRNHIYVLGVLINKDSNISKCPLYYEKEMDMLIRNGFARDLLPNATPSYKLYAVTDAGRNFFSDFHKPDLKVHQAEFVDELADLLARYGANITCDPSGDDINIALKGFDLPYKATEKITARFLRKFRDRCNIV